MNLNQQKLDCRKNLIDNVTGLKAVVNNLHHMINNNDLLYDDEFDREIKALYYFVTAIKKNKMIADEKEHKIIKENFEKKVINNE